MDSIKELLNKFSGVENLLKIPFWWIKRILNSIIEKVDETSTAINETISSVDTLLSSINSTQDSINSVLSSIYQLTLLYPISYSTLTNSIVFSRDNDYLLELTGIGLVDGSVTVKVLDGISLMYILGSYYDIKNGLCTYYRPKNIESLSNMFGSSAKNLTGIDFSKFITTGVTSMGYMFNGCSGLTSLDVSNFDTSAVTSMYNMFNSCSGLTSLDLSNFDTSAVTNMYGMFYNCGLLVSLNVTNFDTSAATNMSSMFYGCLSLTSLDLSSFDTSNVTYMGSMFNYCRKLISLDLSNFDTSAVTDMDSMFSNCDSLKNIKCKQTFKDWCTTNASTVGLTVDNITWEIVE